MENRLTWGNKIKIVQALYDQNPKEEIEFMSNAELLKKVADLPGFINDGEPQRYEAESIRNFWEVYTGGYLNSHSKGVNEVSADIKNKSINDFSVNERKILILREINNRFTVERIHELTGMDIKEIQDTLDNLVNKKLMEIKDNKYWNTYYVSNCKSLDPEEEKNGKQEEIKFMRDLESKQFSSEERKLLEYARINSEFPFEGGKFDGVKNLKEILDKFTEMGIARKAIDRNGRRVYQFIYGFNSNGKIYNVQEALADAYRLQSEICP